MADVEAGAQSAQVLLDGSALRDGRAGAGIGRCVRDLSAELTALAPQRVRLVVPPAPPRSESRPGRHLHAERALLPLAWRRRPALVHGLGGEPLLGWPGARQLVTVHDLELWNDDAAPHGMRGAALRAYRTALGRGLRSCAALISVSASVRDELVGRLAIPAERITVVPNGLGRAFRPAPDGPRDDDADARLTTAAGAPPRYLLWVGSQRRWDPRKGLDVLVAALALVGEAAPPLLLAGVRGEASERVRALAGTAGVVVSDVGTVSDATLVALYRRSAAVVLPSRHEGFGLPALEAMACGAPLVCSDAGNLASLTGRAAHLVPPGDPAAFAEALRGVLADPAAARRRAAAGVPGALSYDWRRAAGETLAVYDSLLSRST